MTRRSRAFSERSISLSRTRRSSRAPLRTDRAGVHRGMTDTLILPPAETAENKAAQIAVPRVGYSSSIDAVQPLETATLSDLAEYGQRHLTEDRRERAKRLGLT